MNSDKDNGGFDETVPADSSAESATLPSPRVVGKSDELADANTQAATLPGPQAPSGLAPGLVIARYKLVEPLGDGGMGTVWRARDTELARDVAIKLVQPKLLRDSSTGSANTSRLFREAQALAQLSHPNIVPVFDVGTTERDEVWVAMEHVVGVPGDRWASNSERTWSEIFEVYRQVGEGLTAAHRAGIVHRDFKPANFVVGQDGRVRVLDFGLARKTGAETASGAIDEETKLTALSDAMTVAGAILGTPAYMSPEQMQGDTADAPSDQYSFAVALWEALYGAHPYPAKTFSDLRDLVRNGSIAAPKANKIPGRFEVALRRAMATDAGERFETMDALLAALKAPIKKGKVALLAGVAAVAVGIGALALVRQEPAQERCSVDDAGWKQAVSPETVQALEARLPEVAPNIIAELSNRRETWIASRQAACQANRKGYETDDVFRARLACLDDVRSRLTRMPSLLSEDDAVTGEDAYRAVLELDRSKQCDGVTRTWFDELDGDKQRELADDLRDGLLRYRANHNLAQLAGAEKMVVRARNLNPSSPALLGRALLLRANLKQRARKYPEAEKDLREALEVFARAKIGEFEAQTWTALVEVVGIQGRIPEARSLATAAKTTAQYDDNPALLARLEHEMARLDEKEGKYGKARERFLAARKAIVEAYGDDSYDLLATDNELGRLALLRADSKSAIRYFEHAIDIARKHNSQNSSRALNANLGLAQAYSLLGEGKRSIAIYEQVLEGQQLTLGPEHPATIDTAFMLGNELASYQKLEQALTVMHEALAVQEKNADDHSIASALASVGNVEVDLGLYKEAIATLSRSREIYENLSDTSISLAAALLPLSRAYRFSGDCKAAVEPMVTARTILSDALGADHEFTGLTYAEEASCALAARNATAAATLFERAIATYGDASHVQLSRAEALLGLGQAETRIPTKRKNARAHVAEALAICDSRPEMHDPKLRAKAAAWLDAH